MRRTGKTQGTGRGARRPRAGIAPLTVVAAMLALGGCGGSGTASAPAPAPIGSTPPTSSSSPAAGDFWSALRFEAAETDRTDTFEALVARSDAVLQGRIVGFALSRTVGDTPEEAMTYGTATVQVDRAVRGTAPSPTIPLELVLPVPPDEAPEAFAARVAAMRPSEPVTVFVRAKGGAREAGLFRLVNFGGLWTFGPSGPATPLSVPSPDERFGSSLAGLATPEDLVARVRGVPPPPA